MNETCHVNNYLEDHSGNKYFNLLSSAILCRISNTHLHSSAAILNIRSSKSRATERQCPC